MYLFPVVYYRAFERRFPQSNRDPWLCRAQLLSGGLVISGAYKPKKREELCLAVLYLYGRRHGITVKCQYSAPRSCGSHLYSHGRCFVIAPNGQEKERDELEAIVKDIIHWNSK